MIRGRTPNGEREATKAAKNRQPLLGPTVEEEVKAEAIKAAMLGQRVEEEGEATKAAMLGQRVEEEVKSMRKVKPQKRRCSGRGSKTGSAAIKAAMLVQTVEDWK